jgi:hypothetical protein
MDAQQFDALFHARNARLLYGLGERDCGCELRSEMKPESKRRPVA